MSDDIQLNDKPDEDSLEFIVSRIMAAHWDMVACSCWVCEKGRAAGLRPMGHLLCHVNENRRRFPVPYGLWEHKRPQ